MTPSVLFAYPLPGGKEYRVESEHPITRWGVWNPAAGAWEPGSPWERRCYAPTGDWPDERFMGMNVLFSERVGGSCELIASVDVGVLHVGVWDWDLECEQYTPDRIPLAGGVQ